MKKYWLLLGVCFLLGCNFNRSRMEDESRMKKLNMIISMEKDIISKFNEKFPWNGDTKEIADTAIARQLLDM